MTNESKEPLEKKVRELEWQVKLLEHDLIHDPLTGLKTRAFFEHEVSVWLEVILRENSIKQGNWERKEKPGFKNLSILYPSNPQKQLPSTPLL